MTVLDLGKLTQIISLSFPAKNVQDSFTINRVRPFLVCFFVLGRNGEAKGRATRMLLGLMINAFIDGLE